MHVEIAICTWNRAESLRRTLTSIAAAHCPTWIRLGVIVVDNGSTDGTAEVLDQYRSRMNLRWEREGQAGHTFARNRAVELAQGDLLLWTDDDVDVDSGWIEAYAAAAADVQIDFWGGPIRPRLEPASPAWIEASWPALQGCFAARDLGEWPIPLSPTELPYGANFAIRTSVQKAHPFDVTLGRRRNEVLGDDELEMMRGLLAEGHRGRWVPTARVDHVIPPERATRRYVRDYFVGQGRRLFASGQAWTDRPRGLWWHWQKERWLYALTCWTRPSPTSTAHLIRSGLAEGQYRASLNSPAGPT